MSKETITLEIPILDNVEQMEVVKTFTEEQLWYVCAIAKAFEKQKEVLDKIKEYAEKNKIIGVIAREENEYMAHILELLEEIE